MYSSNLKDGMIVRMVSDGNNVTISKENEFIIDNINIKFIDENSLPESKDITAVFLIGFIDGEIIAIKNERGWDIPGGHVELTDLSLKDALIREIDEEAGAFIKDAKPYAVIQFHEIEKAMLFYVSDNCNFIDFIPKKDSFERKLMPISDFIGKYNWKKSVIELLIKRALLVVNK